MLEYFYSKQKKTSFKIRAILYCAIIDFFTIRTIQQISTPSYLKKTKVLDKALATYGINIEQMSMEHVLLIADKIKLLVAILTILIAAVQLTCYICFFFEKKFAIHYLRLISGIGFISLFTGPFYIKLDINNFQFMLIGFSFLYLWTFFGIKSYFFQKTN